MLGVSTSLVFPHLGGLALNRDQFHFRSTAYETASGDIADVELFKWSQPDQYDMVIEC